MDDQKQSYYQAFAEVLALQILPSAAIKPFIGDHPKLIGDYAEAQVRNFVRRVVSPLRVSRGAVIAAERYRAQKAKEVDTIIWTPNPLPALVEADDFALVPWENSMGILEIKNSAYSGVGKHIADILDRERDLTAGHRLGLRVVPAVLGVIVLAKEAITESRLKELISDDRVVVLLHREDDDYRPDMQALLTLVNYLAGIRKRAQDLTPVKLRRVDLGPWLDDTATAYDDS